jgi:oligosaccharide repeat unit polymerase
MSYTLAYITLLVLSLNIITYWRTYYFKAILHPGFAFSILWIASIVSWLITTSIKSNFRVVYPQFVNELNGYVLFIASAFFLLQKFGKKKVLKTNYKWDVEDFQFYYNILVLISFLSVISFYFSSGATFDVAINRAKIVESGIDTGYEVKSVYAKLQSILMSFYFPCAIYAGYVLGKNAEKTNNNNRLSISKKFMLFLPGISILLSSFIKGGRSPIVQGVIYYIFGLGIAFSQIHFKDKIYIKKVRNFLIALFILFNLYSTFVNFTRLEKLNNTENLTWNGYPALKPFAGVLEYLSCHYMGYQYRRVDAITENKLEMGVTTFNGFLFFTIPFSETIGLNISPGQLLGLKQFNTYEYINYNTTNPKWHYSTFTSFLYMYDDFGYIGTFLVLALLVIISHYLYVKFLTTTHKYFTGIYLLYIFWYFWATSIFPSYFSTPISTPFFLLLFVDLIRGLRPQHTFAKPRMIYPGSE